MRSKKSSEGFMTSELDLGLAARAERCDMEKETDEEL